MISKVHWLTDPQLNSLLIVANYRDYFKPDFLACRLYQFSQTSPSSLLSKDQTQAMPTVITLESSLSLLSRQFAHTNSRLPKLLPPWYHLLFYSTKYKLPIKFPSYQPLIINCLAIGNINYLLANNHLQLVQHISPI